MNNWFSLKRSALVCVLAVAGLAIAEPTFAEPAITEPEVAGIVKTTTGSVQVERNSNLQALSVGSKVYQNDRIFTGGSSSVGITLKDDTRISLGSSSSFSLTQFAYNPNTREGSFVGSILKGSLRFVTGLIGKVSPKSVSIKTPSSTIGIRGTDFIVTVGENEEVSNAK